MKLEGTKDIVRFNWPFYMIALAFMIAGGLLAALAPMPLWVRLSILAGLILAAWWWIASLIASWWVYDASSVMAAGWIDALLGRKPERWVNLHAGLDQTTPMFTQIWGPPAEVFDIFDAKEMTEPSILRARKLARNAIRATAVDRRSLPLDNGSIDTALLIFAAHELRRDGARLELFLELNRVLLSGGNLVIVEHLRDFPNFAAFGPGFLHFLPRSSWLACAEKGGFKVSKQIKNTPFISAFLLEKQ